MKAMGVSGIFFCWKQGLRKRFCEGFFIGYLQLNFSQKPFIFCLERKGKLPFFNEILIHNFKI